MSTKLVQQSSSATTVAPRLLRAVAEATQPYGPFLQGPALHALEVRDSGGNSSASSEEHPTSQQLTQSKPCRSIWQTPLKRKQCIKRC